MNGDYTPGSLDAKLLKEGGCNNTMVGHERVRIKEGTANNTHHHDTKTAAKYLRGKPDNSTTKHGAKIGNDSVDVSASKYYLYVGYEQEKFPDENDVLGDRNFVCAKVILVLQHGRIEILGAMRHEVEASHEQNQIGQ